MKEFCAAPQRHAGGADLLGLLKEKSRRVFRTSSTGGAWASLRLLVANEDEYFMICKKCSKPRGPMSYEAFYPNGKVLSRPERYGFRYKIGLLSDVNAKWIARRSITKVMIFL